jgi:hypothetical protein
VLIQLDNKKKVKRELDEMYPGDAGVYHEIPLPTHVFIFHEHVMNSTRAELEMLVIRTVFVSIRQQTKKMTV